MQDKHELIKLFEENINKQIASNQGRNLYYKGIDDSLKFIPGVLEMIETIGEIDADLEISLINYITNLALQKFCEVNQFYSFDKQAQKALRDIYIELFSAIRSNTTSLDSISRKHYGNLKKWLRKTNEFAEKIYSSKGEIVESVLCSEYSPELQIAILQIDLTQIIEPVLDIGCGKSGNLVNHFRDRGIEAYGFDRFGYDDSFFSNSDWLEFKYEQGKWGMITSNLGFSNHFLHHHLRNDGSFIDYGRKYMEILNSLKIGGSFHYAPDLPFIEQYLDDTLFHVTKRNVGTYDFKSTKVKRIKG